MKTTQLAVATALLSLGTAQAAVTTINLTDVGAISGASDIGTFTVDDTAAGNVTSATATFTVSLLDLTGDGSANDSFTFITTVATGGVAGNLGFSDNKYQHKGSGQNNLNGADETLTVTINAGSVVFGNGGYNLDSIVFNGFTGFDLTDASASESVIYLDPVADVTITGSQTHTFATADLDGFTVSGIGTNTDNKVRISNFNFDYTITTSPVPEPSAAALLGLGGLALILRRRK